MYVELKKIPICLKGFFKSKGIHQVQVSENKFYCFDSDGFRNRTDQDEIIDAKWNYEELQRLLEKDLPLIDCLRKSLWNYTRIKKYIPEWRKALYSGDDELILASLQQFWIKEIRLRETLILFRAIVIKNKGDPVLDVLIPLGKKVANVYYRFHAATEKKDIDGIDLLLPAIYKIYLSLLNIYQMLLLQSSVCSGGIIYRSELYDWMKKLELDFADIENNTGIPIVKFRPAEIHLSGLEVQLLCSVFMQKAEDFFPDLVLSVDEFFSKLSERKEVTECVSTL